MLSSLCSRWFALAALTGAVLGCAVARADQAPVDAIWQIERIEFVYHSSSVRYSCGNLQRRIAAILRAVGAHSTIGVDPGCRSGDLVRYTTVQLTLAVPVEATEANVRTATNFDTRDELVARLRKAQLPNANDLVRFPASWRSVALTRSAPLALGPGDCDLLRALRDEVFPRLRVRVVSSGLHCDGSAGTRIGPRLQVNALMPART